MFSLTLVQCASFCQTISHNAVVNVLISCSSCAFPSQGTCNHNGVNIIESQPGRGIVSPPKIIYRGISGRGCYLGNKGPTRKCYAAATVITCMRMRCPQIIISYHVPRCRIRRLKREPNKVGANYNRANACLFQLRPRTPKPYPNQTG